MPSSEKQKQRDNETLAKRYRVFMDALIARKGGECAKCESIEDLEFDHIDWRTKVFTISHGWRMRDREAFEREVQKCQLLCSLCHGEKTKADLLEMRGSFTHGTMYGWMKVKCECETCLAGKRVWLDARNEKRRVLDTTVRGPYKEPAEHGTYKRYKRGCKCTECKAANTRTVTAVNISKVA